MKQFALAAFLVVLTFSCSASKTAQPEPDVAKEPEAEAPAKKGDAVDDAPSDAVRVARESVETAALLAIPLQPLESKVIQGFALPLYAELPGLSYEQMLAAVRESGASHVSVVVSWDQRTIYSNTIRPNPDKGPSDSRVGEVISAARAQGLKVMLFPIIHVKLRNQGEWRGKMAPEDLPRWKQEYTDFILHYARLAAAHGAEIYSVGSELGALEFDEEFWRGLIKETREIYDGQLLYSANWDHYTKPEFWDALDFIGVSSYFEIAREEDESITDMVERWRGFRTEMLAFAKEHDRRLIMTEVGYPSMPSAATKPWDYTKKGAPDGNAQLAAFRAMAQTWTIEGDDADQFAGLFIWHAWGPGGDEDGSYAVWDKPTERFVDHWYAD